MRCAATSLVFVFATLALAHAARAQTTATASIAPFRRVRTLLVSSEERERMLAVSLVTNVDRGDVENIRAMLGSWRATRPAAEMAGHAAFLLRTRATAATLSARVLEFYPRIDDDSRIALEPLLYIDALERLGGNDAWTLALDILALDNGLWGTEMRAFVRRLGPSIGPLLITLVERHPTPLVRRTAAAALTTLSFTDPRRGVQERDPRVLADLLLAYARVRRLDAMAPTATLLGSDRAIVRESARTAMASYGRHAIWVLRETYATVTDGQTADTGWGTTELLRRICEVHDNRLLARVTPELAQADAAIARGDAIAAVPAIEIALRRAPTFPGRERFVSPLRTAASHHAARGEWARARSLLSRAERLATDEPTARSIAADIEYIDARVSLTRSVVDVPALQAATEARGAFAVHATQLLDGVSGRQRSRDMALVRIAVGALGVIGLLAVFGSLGLLRRLLSRALRTFRLFGTRLRTSASTAKKKSRPIIDADTTLPGTAL